MATNYNANPDATSNLTGWTRTGGGTLTSTADGALWKPTAGAKDARYLQIALKSSAPTGNYQITGLKIRRNTAASGKPYQIVMTGDTSFGFSSGYYIDTVDLPVGQFITLPNTYNTLRNDTTSWYLRIYGDDDGKAMDLTITGVDVNESGDVAAGADIDSNDVQFSWTQADNSLAATFTKDPGNEGVSRVAWNFGDGSAVVNGAAAGSRTTSPYVKQNPITHTFPARGRYTVQFTGGNFDTQNQTAAAYTYRQTAVSSSQVVTVPLGPFTADFNAEINYLALNVDASPSVSPTLDPIDTYTWNWGDGTTSTGKQQSHTYSQAGNYAVALTISTTATQRSHTTTKTVTGTAPVNPANYFTVDKKLLQASFSPSITDGTSYLWDFGDGGTSTEKAPVYFYAVAGTYSVTLTVNGNNTTTQSLTVTDTYKPLSLPESVRLEVAVPPAAGVIYNRLRNPDGAQGSYGWVTPVAGSTLVGSSTTDGPDDRAVPGAKLVFKSSGSGLQWFTSTGPLATAGQYVGAQFVCTAVDGYYRASVEALNASGAVIGSSNQTGYLGALGTAQRTTPYLLPAGTVAARVRIEHYSNTSAGTPAAGKILQLRHVMLATAATSAAVNAAPYTDAKNWQNLIGPTTSIDIDREALQVGTFKANVADSSLDPATADTIRPGQDVRVRVPVADDAGNVVWETLIYATLNNAHVDYLGKANYTAKDTRISLTATDAMTQLASTPEPRGVALIQELPELLESANVPFEVNGSAAQVAAINVVSWNENATVADQLAVTRDTQAGQAFVNRSGVLIVNDPSHTPSAVSAVIDEQTYSDLDATFDTDSVMNSVTILWNRYTPGTTDTDGNPVDPVTEQIPYGPYSDAASIDKWGLHPRTYTMQGVENNTNISSKANVILAANKDAAPRINSVTLPIRYVEDLTRGKALLDIGDLVTLNYTRTGTSQNVRITGLSHHITPKSWLMTLEFSREGVVAAPQYTPAPPAAPVSAITPVASRRLANTAQSVPNSSTTVVALDTDNISEGVTWNSSSNAFSIITPGLYTITGAVQYNTGPTSGRGECSLYVGNTQQVSAMDVFVSGTTSGSSISCTRRLNAGNLVSLRTYQTSGAAATLRNGIAFTFLEVVRVGD